MIINGATLKAISKGFSKIFNKAFGQKESTYRRISTVIENVKTLSVSYAWLGDTPKMREWIGDKVLKDLKAFKYEITKKDFEVTIEVDRDDIKYDNLGVVKPRIEQMAQEADDHYDETLYEMIEANGVCYDGQPFFATTHDVGGTTFSNLSTGDASALSQTSFLQARAEMRGLVGETGKSLKIRPNLLIVPPELEATAIKILNADKIDNGESNITKGMAEYMVVDDLTDANAWYLIDDTKALKPFIVQINEKPKFIAMDSDTDENAFMRKKYRFSVEAEDNCGFGLWQLAHKSTGVE